MTISLQRRAARQGRSHGGQANGGAGGWGARAGRPHWKVWFVFLAPGVLVSEFCHVNCA